MADSDDTNTGAGGKKTLTLKGGPSSGSRPGMSRPSRTVVVEKRTRRFGAPGAPGTPGSGAPAQGSPRPQGAPSGQRPGGNRPPLRAPQGNRPAPGLT
ncbi:MAG: translation initiation factor IF-2, partial [Devosia nanyangense]|nr:translation initiation factor IF-2 [Devosia nanyangense]